MSIRYSLSAPRPDDHRLYVEARFPAGPATLVFPSWAPGSYLQREFARNLRNISASTEDGTPVAIVKLSRNTWRVEGSEPVIVRYEVYCREKTVRTPFVDGDLQFWLPSNVLLHDADRRDVPHVIELDVPAGQVGVCLLGAEVEGPSRARWEAPDVDTLMDAVVAIGAFQHTAFEVDGVPHHHWIEAPHNGDLDAINEALRSIVAAAQATVGGPLPYPRYDFVTLLAAKGHGGLEHKGGSVLLRPRFSLREPKELEELLTLAAHEHFHAWNVKRIHPDTLGPRFAYDREHYTRDLWWLEGGTVYYEERISFRSGVVSEARYYERLADLVTRLADTPGRRHQAIDESSFDAWIKLYRPGEDSSNSTISYYLKGAVAVLCLDLELLHLTAGRVGIDDVLRALWERWGRHGVGYPEGGTQRALAAELLRADGVPEATIHHFLRLFDAAVSGTAPLDVAGALDHAGLDLVADAPKAGAWLGLKLAGGERIEISAVREDGPCAGVLSAGDELLAIDGVRLLSSGLSDHLRDLPIGRPVTALLARDGLVIERELVPTAAPPPAWKVVPRPAPSAERAAVRKAFLAGTRASPTGVA